MQPRRRGDAEKTIDNEGAEMLGLELDEHIAHVIAAMQSVAPQLGFE